MPGSGELEGLEREGDEAIDITGEVIDPQGDQQLAMFAAHESQWVAPLPPAEQFAGYENVLPGSAERIMAMAEREQERRLSAIDTITGAEIEQSRNGQVIAFLLATICVTASIVFFAVGNAVAGGLLLSLPVVLLIRSFLRS